MSAAPTVVMSGEMVISGTISGLIPFSGTIPVPNLATAASVEALLLAETVFIDDVAAALAATPSFVSAVAAAVAALLSPPGSGQPITTDPT
jgi:hypothetical protein